MTTTTHKQLALIGEHITFMPHQVEGIRDLSRRTSFLLADVMGLGKTIQALAVTAIAFELGETNRALVVCPASLKGNWEDEIKEMTKFSCMVLEGTPKQRSDQLVKFAEDDLDILIVNYEQVVAHGDELSAMGFGIAIYDEAHYIKSHKSKRTKAVFKLSAGRHFLLTGSPILNQVNDLWALLHRIDPAEWGTYWSFVNRYCLFGGYMDKQIVGVKNEAELRERLARYMLRRTKDEIELPDKLPPNYIKLEPHPEQKKLYKQAVEELRIEAPAAETPFEIENAMVKLLRLRQICGTTATIPGHEDHSSKLDYATEMCQELIGSGEPVVIFTQFREVQRCMVRRLEEVGIGVHQLHGDIPPNDRRPTVNRWTERAEQGKPEALVTMLQVGGVGLTMTAASHCIFLDRLYAPKLNEQAEDRLHRIGQTKPVSVHVLQIRNSVDQRVERIVTRKQDVFDAVVEDEDAGWKKKLLQSIFEDDEEIDP